MGRKRAFALTVALYLAALGAAALGIDSLAIALAIGAPLILFKYLPRRRMYFSRDELLESAGPNADEPKCRNCGYDLRGTFMAGIYECPECNKRASKDTIKRWTTATKEIGA